MAVIVGTLTKLHLGQRAGFHGEIGTFQIEHASLDGLTLGVHEAMIDAVGLTEKQGRVLMALGGAPIIGKCVFVKPDALIAQASDAEH